MSESEAIQGVIDGLRSTFEVRRVVLFGSRSRRAARQDSDFDILAVVESDVPYRRRQGIARAAIEEKTEADLDLIVMTPGELEQAMRRFDSVARSAIEEGTVLYAA